MKAKLKNYNKFLIILASFFVIVFICSLFVFLHVRGAILGYYVYGVSANIGDYVGIKLDTDKLYFGTIPVGGHAYRVMNLNSSASGVLEFRASGSVSKLLFLGSNISSISSEHEEQITIFAGSLKTTRQGKYDGTLHIFILKYEDWITNMFLPGEKLDYYNDPSKFGGGGSRITLNVTKSQD